MARLPLWSSSSFSSNKYTSKKWKYVTLAALEPNRSIPISKIFWLHIQKTGTSLFNTIYLHFCPGILQSSPDLLSQNQNPLIEYDLVKAFPVYQYCIDPPVHFYYIHSGIGFHHPYPSSSKKRRSDFTTLAMLRDPIQRLLSAYSFRNLHSPGIPHYSRLNNPNITFEEYIHEPQIPSCQIKMVLGYRCNEIITPSSLSTTTKQLNLTLAMERISSPSFYFGLTDRWEESICLFHYWYGGTTQPFELQNNRPTQRRNVDITSGIRNYLKRNDLDIVFVEEATKLFERRLDLAGCHSPLISNNDIM